jgi:hypothetical protein
MAETPIPGTTVRFKGHDFMFAVTGPNPDALIVQVYDPESGTLLGQPIRFKDADGRISADRPSVSPSHFITEGGVDGPITDG